jgi:diguanylate cyclase (GGDEF)-like protein/PAS domain S-box-containing protein
MKIKRTKSSDKDLPTAPAPSTDTLLRQKAEEHLSHIIVEQDTSALEPSTTTERLLHELQVYQVELELQNEELITSRNAAEAAASDYSELYDFAPIGYVTLNRAGDITRSNLAAANLLNTGRAQLQGKHMAKFVDKASLIKFNTFLTQSYLGYPQPDCEITLRLDNKVSAVQIKLNVNDTTTECRLVLIDISERKELEATLKEREFWLTESQRAGLIGTYVMDLQTNTWISSTVLDEIFGLMPDTRRTITTWNNLVHPDDRDAVRLNLSQDVTNKRKAFNREYRIIRPCDGATRWIWERGKSSFDTCDNPHKVFGTIQDISDRQQAKVRLQLAASVFTHAREGIMISDANDTIIEVNDTFTRITGFSRKEVIGQSTHMLRSNRQSPEFYTAIKQVLDDKGYWYGEAWNQRNCGEIYPEMQTISVVRDATGKMQHYVSLFTDISDQKEHLQELEHAAHFDTLTNLPNRALLTDRLLLALLQCERRDKMLAVVYLDLDGFKRINDNHGHSTGDQLLIAVSQRMTEALREGDTLARIGGDEFVAVLIDLEQPSDCHPVLERLLQAASQVINIEDITLQVSSSIGVSIYPETATQVDLLLRQADQAMYTAKEKGKNCYHFFDANSAVEARNLHESLESIRQALDQEEFQLYYQPKVNIKTGAVVGVEALIRWQHTEQGLLEPRYFLPVVEDHAIRVELGEWVINTALTQISEWQTLGLKLPISVNVGAYQLQDHYFLEHLTAALAAHPDVSPGRLELEILETYALEDVTKVASLMLACQNLGVDFALDDFGTGYSSLTYLKRLPAASIKIDQSFVRDMLTNADDLAIVQGVIGLAGIFNRRVIAEGVETTAHAKMLLSLNCNIVQGFGIAHPMPAIDLPLWVERWNANQTWAS